jgi:hypothetical protein
VPALAVKLSTSVQVIAQMLGYLNITSLEVALLLNFKEATLTWKRVVRGNQEEDRGLRG